MKYSANSVWENKDEYDVAVVGAGHAGCEAALATARLGFKTVMFTVSAMNDEYQTKIGSVRDMLDKMYKDINDKHKKVFEL